MHYIPTSHLYNKCHYLHSHSHSTNFESQNSHLTNANFDQLRHNTAVEDVTLWLWERDAVDRLVCSVYSEHVMCYLYTANYITPSHTFRSLWLTDVFDRILLTIRIAIRAELSNVHTHMRPHQCTGAPMHHQANVKIVMLKSVIEAWLKCIKCIETTTSKKFIRFYGEEKCGVPTKTVHTLPRYRYLNPALLAISGGRG